MRLRWRWWRRSGAHPDANASAHTIAHPDTYSNANAGRLRLCGQRRFVHRSASHRARRRQSGFTVPGVLGQQLVLGRCQHDFCS